ncbi:hypothetical protein BLNAU_13228 [Blattamonas nauphoetae]|uniref:Importin subunit alpha n=1 Tax=Blattamonas nauphoetae TaxID=2049346 RepID=A0ABQ9XKI3_9EUKA|nr:hypothetical protein BLNAU_13228 [Blattamonas nauphoetae]
MSSNLSTTSNRGNDRRFLFDNPEEETGDEYYDFYASGLRNKKRPAFNQSSQSPHLSENTLSNEMEELLAPIPAQIQNLASPDDSVVIEALDLLRIPTQQMYNIPSERFATFNLAESLAPLLLRENCAEIQLKTLFILINLTKSFSRSAMPLFQSICYSACVDAFPILLQSSEMSIVEHTAWLIHNLCDYSTTLRNHIIVQHLVQPLFTIIQTKKLDAQQAGTILSAISGLAKNTKRPQIQEQLSRINSNNPPFDPSIETDEEQLIIDQIPALIKLIPTCTEMVISHILDILFEITNRNYLAISKMADQENISLLVDLLPTIKTAMTHEKLLKALGQLTRTTSDHIQILLNTHLIVYLTIIVKKVNNNVLRDIIWICANIANGTPDQGQQIFDSGLLSYFLQIQSEMNPIQIKYLCDLLSNLITTSPALMEPLISNNVVGVLLNILRTDHKTYTVPALCTLNYFLDTSIQNQKTSSSPENTFISYLLAEDFQTVLGNYSSHEDGRVSELSKEILSKTT